jgi:hypothetical protein
VSRALTHVEWIEQKSIQADRKTLQVKFDVNDKKQVSLDGIKNALPERYRSGLSILKGP